MSTWWGFAGDRGYAWRVLADLDFSGLPVHVRYEGGALEKQPPVSKHVVRHLEVYRRLGHLGIVVLRYGEVSGPVYQAVVRDLQIQNRYSLVYDRQQVWGSVCSIRIRNCSN